MDRRNRLQEHLVLRVVAHDESSVISGAGEHLKRSVVLGVYQFEFLQGAGLHYQVLSEPADIFAVDEMVVVGAYQHIVGKQQQLL